MSPRTTSTSVELPTALIAWELPDPGRILSGPAKSFCWAVCTASSEQVWSVVDNVVVEEMSVGTVGNTVEENAIWALAAGIR